MEITLRLKLEDVNSLLNLLGETPTKLGFYPLALNIRAQAEAQTSLAKQALQAEPAVAD